ncbi:MAG: ComEA family DNA-binding protein, partial [Jatrophihabitans sp.]
SLLALLAVVAVVGGGTAWWVLSGRPSEVSVRAVAGPAPDAPTAVPGHALGAPAPSRSAPGVPAVATPVDLVVDVAGQVLHPGVYRLPTGSRVVDALRAAGGALPGVSTASLNLAAPLRDGQQVALGVPAASDTAPGADPGGSGSAPGGPVDLNTAGREQLQSLPGVGPVLAQHILDWRAEHGRFTGVEQLTEVSGIGPAKFAALRAHVTV